MKRSIFALFGLILLITLNVRAEVHERAHEQADIVIVGDHEIAPAVDDLIIDLAIKAPSPALAGSILSIEKDESSVTITLPTVSVTDDRVRFYRRARDGLTFS